jgi:rhodanese-related sulfurtransferase
MFLATFWDWALPIGLGLLIGFLIAAGKRHDYSQIHLLEPEEFRQNMRRGQLVDLRPKADHALRRINGARSFPKRSVFAELHKLRSDMPVFLYDEHQGPLVRGVARKLVRKGFHTVYVLRGGLSKWPFPIREE